MGLLGSIMGGPQAMTRSGGGISPLTLALLGTLAYRTFKGKGRLADILGVNNANAPNPAPNLPGRPGAGPDLLSPGALISGLGNLLNRFRQNGHGAQAESWIAAGENKVIAPAELGEALGEERLAWLREQTGLSQADLLAGLSGTLPDAVDKLTPEGRIPTDEEARRLI